MTGPDATVAVSGTLSPEAATQARPRRTGCTPAGVRPGQKGCSVDMYLLALALGRPIHAEATCPVTGTPITGTLPSTGWSASIRPTAVVAVVNLDAELTLGLDRIDADVCAQQPFFASHKPRRDGWLTTPRVGSLRCGPSTPKPAASSTGWRSQRQPSHCRERGRR